MTYYPNNPNGQTTKANSQPVTLASDQNNALETGGNLATAATNTGTTATNTTNLPNVIGTAGSAIPSKLLQVGGSDGTNARAIKTNTSGQLDIRPLTSSDQVTTVPSGTQTVSGTVTSNQGTANTVANGWPVKVTDGTNTMPTMDAAARKGFHAVTDGTNTMAVKAASTAAAAADPSAVVALSPNSPLPAGTNTIGKVNVATATTGGSTPFKLTSAASTNATSVKASAGTVYGIQAFNNGASAAYLKLYNKASAPTVGTDTPVKVIMLPAGGGATVPVNDIGIAFGTGIAFAVTGALADSDTTAISANQVAVNIDYN